MTNIPVETSKPESNEEAQTLGTNQPKAEKKKSFANNPYRRIDVRVLDRCNLNAAFVFDRIFLSIDFHRRQNHEQFHFDDNWWMFDTAESFQEQLDFLSLSSIKRALSDLKKAGLICVKRGQRMPNYYAISDEEILKCQPDTIRIENGDGESSYSVKSDGLKCQPDTICYSNNLSNNHRGGEARAREDTPPLDINSFNSENDIELATDDSQENNKTAPPDDRKTLAELWYAWVLKNDLETNLSVSDFYEGLGEIQKILGGSWGEINEMITHGVNDKFYCSYFLSPKCYQEKNRRGRRIISTVFVEMKAKRRA